MDQEKLLYKAEEAAQMLGVSRSTVFQLAAEGELAYVTIGSRAKRFTRASLEEFVEKKLKDGNGPG